MNRLNYLKCNQSQITELVQPIAAFAPHALTHVCVSDLRCTEHLHPGREGKSFSFCFKFYKNRKKTQCMLHSLMVFSWLWWLPNIQNVTYRLCPAATCCLRSQSSPRLLYVVPDPIYTPPVRMSHCNVEHSTLATLLTNQPSHVNLCSIT